MNEEITVRAKDLQPGDVVVYVLRGEVSSVRPRVQIRFRDGTREYIHPEAEMKVLRPRIEPAVVTLFPSSQRFRKKPVVIEAIQVDTRDYDGLCELISWCSGRAVDDEEHDTAVVAIDTLEGTMFAIPGDWIIKGVQGEFYPCKDYIFEATYEAVSDA
jgi:hypothetical protein